MNVKEKPTRSTLKRSCPWCSRLESNQRPLPYQGSALPTELREHETSLNKGSLMERETGIEPAPSAWKAEVLPLNYSRQAQAPATPLRYGGYCSAECVMVEGGGFEPPKA